MLGNQSYSLRIPRSGHSRKLAFSRILDLGGRRQNPSKCLPDSHWPDRVVLSANSPPESSSAISARAPLLRVEQSAHSRLARLFGDYIGRKWPSARTVDLRPSISPGSSVVFLSACSEWILPNAEGAIQRHHGAVEADVYAKSGFDPHQQFPGCQAISPPMFRRMIGDWRALDRRLASWPVGIVWVVTDRGAKPSNTTVMRSENFTLPASELRKNSQLAALSVPQPPAPEAFRVVSSKLALFGKRLEDWAPSFAERSRRAAPHLLLAACVPSLPCRSTVKCLALSLKLMPHLLPSDKEDSVDWLTIINELESLGRQAGRAAAVLGSQV